MTRSNLNFVYQNRGEAPRVLFHYHNGDQYPEGLLQFFGIEEFLLCDRPWTPDDFCAWIRKNYRVACRTITTLANGVSIDAHAETDELAEPEDLGEGGQPKIYYTNGFITDYSYVFTPGHRHGRHRKDGSRRLIPENRVCVWKWKRLIFDGNAKTFLRFCQKRVTPAIVPADQATKAALSNALRSALS